MQWSDVIAVPSRKILREFSGLWLIFFTGLAGWRVWHGNTGRVTVALAVVGVVLGVIGLLQPRVMRPIYTGWMIVAFPIGWVVSRVMIAVMFFGIITPFAYVFRMMGRDALRLRRPQTTSHWLPKAATSKVEDYFRQS